MKERFVLCQHYIVDYNYRENANEGTGKWDLHAFI